MEREEPTITKKLSRDYGSIDEPLKKEDGPVVEGGGDLPGGDSRGGSREEKRAVLEAKRAREARTSTDLRREPRSEGGADPAGKTGP
jgi:hypothetical protein